MFFKESIEFSFYVGDRLAVTPVGCVLIVPLVFSPLLLDVLDTNHNVLGSCMRVCVYD